jgi:hypothetical protein
MARAIKGMGAAPPGAYFGWNSRVTRRQQHAIPLDFDATVAQIGHRGEVGENVGQPGGGEALDAVAGAVHRH